MTLDQLRIFVEVAKREHMTRAAENLCLSQSAVSGAIQSLEERHNISFFHRVGRRIELTQDGRFFLEHAQAVLRSAEAAQLALLELRGLRQGSITIHASQTTGSYWLPEHLVRFRAAYPDVGIKLAIGNTDQVASAVASGSAEIGFIEGAIQSSELMMRQVHLDQLVIVVGKRHPWKGIRRLKGDQINQTKWVLRERGSGTRSVFEQALARLGFKIDSLDMALELPSNEAVIAAVESGAGATAISRVVVKSALRLNRLHVVPFERIERPFMLLCHRQRKIGLATRGFIARLKVDNKNLQSREVNSAN